MNTPTIDFIMEVSDLTSHFGMELAKLCKKYGRDVEREVIKACIILTDDNTLNLLRK